MIKYECESCGNPLCPEECNESKVKQRGWLDSNEFKRLQDSREPLDFVL